MKAVLSSKKTNVSPLIALVAERLYALRQGHKLTQAETAERMGINRHTYRRLETGKNRRLSTKSLEQISSAFGIEAYTIVAPKFHISKIKREMPKLRRN